MWTKVFLRVRGIHFPRVKTWFTSGREWLMRVLSSDILPTIFPSASTIQTPQWHYRISQHSHFWTHHVGHWALWLVMFRLEFNLYAIIPLLVITVLQSFAHMYILIIWRGGGHNKIKYIWWCICRIHRHLNSSAFYFLEIKPGHVVMCPSIICMVLASHKELAWTVILFLIKSGSDT